ncbi:MAG: hypothetical protein WC947_08225 [Elusimicrobiota bacterium]
MKLNFRISFIVTILTLCFYTEFIYSAQLSPITLPKKKFVVFELKLKEVSFSGTKYHVVTADDGSGDYDAPHWQDNSSPIDGDADDPGDRKYAVAFTRNTKMKVSVKFFIKPPSVFSGITKVKGDGPGNLDFPETDATLSGNELTIANVECSNAFVDEIDIFDPMEIAWKVSPDGGNTWFDAGTNKNQCYITWKDPTTTVYHTAVHIGCKIADGMKEPLTDADVCYKIWDAFTGCNVKRALLDGTSLYYYKSFLIEKYTTEELLRNADGQCSAWARFFIDTMSDQGIDHTNDLIYFEAIETDGFLIKNWSFDAGTGISGNTDYPYLNIPDPPYKRDTEYKWKFAEVKDQIGISGQGPNANPASLFTNHKMTKFDGKYYDPSYGVTYNTNEEFEDGAIDAYFIHKLNWPVDEPAVNLDLNGDGDKTDVGVEIEVFLMKKNPPGNFDQNLQEHVYPFGEYP